MKILFVCKSKKIEVLGLMYLAAVVKQCGHEVKIVDITETFVLAITWKPDIIGYSIMTGDRKKFLELNRILKQHLSFTSIVGGPDPTFFPQGYESDDSINMIIKGEGEQTIVELFGSDIRYPNIDSIPHPDRTDFPDMSIRDFIASRGCAGNCSYCYNGTWAKLFPEIPRIRTRSVYDVIKEIIAANPQFVYFQDSTFGSNMKWMEDFSHKYKLYVNIPYHIHLRPNQINEERVLLLHDSNCVSLKIALETSSDRLRKLINRGKTNNEDAYVAARLLRKWNIKLILQNILALPSATIENDLETLEVNIRCKPAYAWCSIFQPYPQTVLADMCIKNGLYTGDFSEIGDNFFDHSVLNISEEYKEQVACLQRIFAFCVEHQTMPKVKDLSWEQLPKFIHNTMRRIGDKRMFPGVEI